MSESLLAVRYTPSSEGERLQVKGSPPPSLGGNAGTALSASPPKRSSGAQVFTVGSVFALCWDLAALLPPRLRPVRFLPVGLPVTPFRAV